MKKTSHILCAVLIMFLSTALVVPHQSPREKKLPTIDRVGFEPVISALGSKTHVPAIVPSISNKDYLNGVKFFCTVTMLTHNEYEVIIGTDPDCGGGNACRIGSFTGKRLRSSRITGTENYPFESRHARKVVLKGGITAYYVDATCGANCDDSKIYWKQGSYEYMVGLKAGKRWQVIELANSAIGHKR